MRAAVLHNAVAPGADASTADVLDQVALVAAALGACGHDAVCLPVPDGRVWEVIAPGDADVAVNLVEAAPGRPATQLAAVAALEALGIPFTGSAAAALWLTTDKIAARAVVADAGLPVAAGGRWTDALLDRVPPPWIVKPAWEDASVGLEGDPVCADTASVRARARRLTRRFAGQPLLLEHFLPGRELNVSLLAGPDGLEVLPVAEIVLDGLPPGVPPLVGWEAKWDQGSDAYAATQRRFPGPDDAALLAECGALARAAAAACGVAGYARVDLRLDEAGRPCILELNANPCLSADAGFMAAAARAGLSAADVVGRIVAAAVPGVAAEVAGVV